QLDRAKYLEDPSERQRADQLVALLTHVAKAFLTDTGLEATIIGQQVFGGHGYVREWGQEQLVRDVRIAQIYEGTNGIQALDLLGRKVVGSQGELLQPLVQDIRALLLEVNESSLAAEKAQLEQALKHLEGVSEQLIAKAAVDENQVNSVAVEYLHLVGYIAYAFVWLKMAWVAKQSGDKAVAHKVKTAKFYFARLLPRIH